MQWEGRPPRAVQTKSGPKSLISSGSKTDELENAVDAELGALKQATTAPAQASAKYVIP